MRILVISILLLSVSIPYAAAHPFTLETNPNSAFNAPVGVTEMHVIYSEAVELGFSSLKVFDSNGDQIDNKDTQYYEGEESLLVTTPPLQEGVYTVTSKVLSKVDGHLVPDAFVFAVGNIKLDRTEQDLPASDLVFLPEAGARFLGLVGQTMVLGAVVASLLIWGTQNKLLIKEELEKLNSTYHGRFMSITGIGLMLVLASNIIMLAIQTMRLESSVLDTIQTTFGATWLFRMIVSAILLGVWFWMDRKKYITKVGHAPMLIFSLVLIGTTTMMGHGAASEQMPAIVLDYIHNLVAAVWIGGIIFFVFVLLPVFSRLDETKKEKMSLVMIPRFSIVFVIAVGVVVITGPTLMWFLESDVGTITESTYGKLIMAKIAIAAVMVGLGSFFQFRVQRHGEQTINSGRYSVHRRLSSSLKIDVVLGVALLGVVALLVNGTLPAGEIQQVEATESVYGLYTAEFSEHAMFNIAIEPFASGNNTISVKVSSTDGRSLPDSDELKIRVSNPQKNITPIEIPLEKIPGEDGNTEFRGDLTFGFSGIWQVEIEAQRTEHANESVLLYLQVKPRLSDIRMEIIEYELPEPSKPLSLLFDGKNSFWLSDPSAPRLWKFDLDSNEFESFQFEGVTSMWLTQDNQGKIWFTDAPGNQIGFIEPDTKQITRLSLPELQPVIYQNTPTFIQSDFQGNIWIAITNKDLILRYDQKQETFEEIRLPEKESLPFALAVDDEGKIWFTESGKGRIGYIIAETGQVREFVPEIPLQSPEALLFDDGMVWVSEHTGNSIAKFDPILETFERVSVPNEEALPYGMSLDKYGNIWIALHTVDDMAVYDPDNDAIIKVPIPTATSFVQFTATDGSGNVWFVEQQGNKLAMVKTTELQPRPVVAPTQIDIKYTELASPLIAMGIVAASLFYVKNIHDKRRLNKLILDA